MLFRELYIFVCVYAVSNASVALCQQWCTTTTFYLSLTSSIMVQLKPEIYKMIVESMLATNSPPDFETKLDQQQNLARMMRVSKVGHSSMMDMADVSSFALSSSPFYTKIVLLAISTSSYTIWGDCPEKKRF